MESLTVRIGSLVAERQELRLGGASAGAIERNRLEIAQAQRELGYALIERYLPTAQTAA
ncbi:MAG: hypothetical protein WBB76_10840 [Gaiellaceae bacterium]